MISSDNLFRNFFENEHITTARLAAFGNDSLNRFTAGNTNNKFSAIIAKLTSPLQSLSDELGGVDTSLNVQKGKTLTNNQMIADFKQTMRDQRGVIANAVGGFTSAAYLEFYPHGLTEYSNIKKTEMEMVTHRVHTAATKYAAQLGNTLTTVLEGFEQAWKTSRIEQELQKGSVDSNRNARSDARAKVETALLVAMYTVGTLFPGDVVKCTSYFDFSLLHAPAHAHNAEKFTGNIVKGQTAIALNRNFTHSVELKLSTISDNASLLAFLGTTADAQPNGSGVTVKAGKSHYLKLSDLGDNSDTFLLIKNLSDVNDASYVLEVKG